MLKERNNKIIDPDERSRSAHVISEPSLKTHTLSSVEREVKKTLRSLNHIKVACLDTAPVRWLKACAD